MIREILTKTAIHRREPNFGSGCDLNIYRGCEHKCKYCFAQYSHKFLENDTTDFFNDIFVKTNNIFTPICMHLFHNGILIALEFFLLFFGQM